MKNGLLIALLLLGHTYLLRAQSPSLKQVEKALLQAEKYEFDSARNTLEEFINQDENYPANLLGKSYFYLSKILWEENEFIRSFEMSDRALFLFDSINDYYWYAYTIYSLSMNNLVLGNYDLALNQTEKAYELFKSINDTTFQIKSLCRRGLVFHDIGEYDEGISACNSADSLHSSYSGHNADLQAIIWGIKAINHDDKGSSDEAVVIYTAILGLESKLSSDREIIRTYNNMGNSLIKLGQLDQAQKYITLNLEANLRNEFPYGIATATTNLGTIAYKKGEFEKSDSLLQKAELIAFKISDTEKILDVLFQKHLLYEMSNRPEKSLDYLKRYHSLKDSLYSLDKQRQIQMLEERFESSQKEQEIAIQKVDLAEQRALNQRNKILLAGAAITAVLIFVIALLNRNRIKREQEMTLQTMEMKSRELEVRAAIDSQEKERFRFARDLHDGLGQLISLLNLNLKNLEPRNDNPQGYESYEQSQEVIDSMHKEIKNICFDLMPQTLIQSGLIAAIEEFINRINQTGHLKAASDVFGIGERLDSLQEISLYRISQEWVNNVMKYSNATQVTLQLTCDEKEITLLIEDDGMGFDKQVLFDSTGNGWKNIQTRSNLIRGVVELDTQINRKGNSLIVNAPRYLSGVSKNTMNKV